MSVGIRGFVEHLVDYIKQHGTLHSGMYTDDEIENDVIKMIWNAYEEY